MELTRVYKVASPMGSDRIRLVGEVAYDHRPRVTEKYWFDVPRELEDYISTTGSPWLACLLPLAAELGEPLRIKPPVDGLLLSQAPRILDTWCEWYPRLHQIVVESDVLAPSQSYSGGRCGAFFSGGVDSSVSVLESVESKAGSGDPLLQDLISVWGFDVPLRNRRAFDRFKRRLRGTARTLDLNFIDIATNLRTGRLSNLDWPGLSHGSALAATGLVLEPYFDTLLIAATNPYKALVHWGSHPDVDPLFSTNRLKLIHHGAQWHRLEKLERLSKSDVMLKNLRVCWARGADYNCGKCAKCYCTMLHLYLLGALDRAESFKDTPFDPHYVTQLRVRDDEVVEYLEAMLKLAELKGNLDIAEAIGRCLYLSRKQGWQRSVRSFTDRAKRSVSYRLPWIFSRYWKRPD